MKRRSNSYLQISFTIIKDRREGKIGGRCAVDRKKSVRNVEKLAKAKKSFEKSSVDG